MSEKLKILLEQANRKMQNEEDGTVADLGLAPTGHLVNDDKKEANVDD